MMPPAFRGFARQTWALSKKNIIIAAIRHPLSTLFRAIILPTAFLTLILEVQNFLSHHSGYGIGSPTPVQALHGDLLGGQDLVFLVPPGLGSDIDTVVQTIALPLRDVASQIYHFTNQTELLTHCRVNIHGSSGCYAAVVFNDSPLTVGGAQTWSYTIRADPQRNGFRFNVYSQSNDEESLYLPLQLAVENAITNSDAIPNNYAFTQHNQAEEDILAKQQWLELVIKTYAIALFISMLSVIYHVVTMVTAEREKGISQLIDVMGGSAMARVCSYVIAFDLIYLPCWIVFGILYWNLLWSTSSIAVSLFWQILTGWALTSASVFAAAWFQKSQLSGIYVVVGFLVMGLGTMILNTPPQQSGSVPPSTVTEAITSLLFPSMNFIYIIAYYCRYEMQGIAVDLLKSPASTPSQPTTSTLPAIAMWMFLVAQIIVYPVLAVAIEKLLHGISFRQQASASSTEVAQSSAALQTIGLSKTYFRPWYKNMFGIGKRSDVVALQDLDMDSQRRQILCLLGANGSGKTTTIDLIAGIQSPTKGSVIVNATTSHLGVCPQRNVLFDELTVQEHLWLWSQIKGGSENITALNSMTEACDLTSKKTSLASRLSGGGKRKLQLACTFIGGSSLCLMDEVTTGLDPLSRRNIWNIILSERSKRSMILTTHFLDECEVLADKIVILSRGRLKCQGPPAALKHQYGGGYRVHVRHGEAADRIEGLQPAVHQDRLVYTMPDSSSAARLVSSLDGGGESDIFVTGPTVEDVFLRVVEESLDDGAKTPGEIVAHEQKSVNTGADHLSQQQLTVGQIASLGSQLLTLLRKRFVILRRNWWPYFFVLAVPIGVTPALNRLLQAYQIPSCIDLTADVYQSTPIRLNAAGIGRAASSVATLDYVAGPLSVNSSLYQVASSFPIGQGFDIADWNNLFNFESSFVTFQQYVQTHNANITLGGIWLGDESSSPTFAWNAENGIYPALLMQNLWSQLRSGVRIDGSHQFLSSLISPSGDTSFLYVTYFCLIQIFYPSLFCLYPTYERIRRVRALQYSNGVRPLPLWLSYILFDFAFVIIISTVTTVTTWRQVPAFWNVGYLFPVLCLYGLSAMLMGYVISIVASSQLAAFATSVGIMAIMFALSILRFSLEEAFTDSSRLQSVMDATSFSLNLIFPIGNVFQALILGLNVLIVACRNDSWISFPGSIYGYGGPILYLCLQVCVLFIFLIWLDREGAGIGSLSVLHTASVTVDSENPQSKNAAVTEEAARVEASENDLLRLLHVTKTFAGNVAVSDNSVGLGDGEVLALLGPNGAGKTTIVNMIRGELRPDKGKILVRGVDANTHIRLAQQHLGVCPQFDALDLMTTREHLDFYARAKGIKNVAEDVDIVMAKVGLTPYASRLAAKLSGGNKRKLSLAIALLGNPQILLLDEPSSSMDAISKRAMWRTLAEIAPGRSVLLTTHSMEEADALATRAAIISSRLLAIGSTQSLRKLYSNVYHVSLILRTAPLSSEDEMHGLEAWVRWELGDGVVFDGESLGGQIRFTVPIVDRIVAGEMTGRNSKTGGIVALIEMLEANKEARGLSYYSVGGATLEMVFMNVVKQNNVLGEDSGPKRHWWQW